MSRHLTSRLKCLWRWARGCRSQHVAMIDISPDHVMGDQQARDLEQRLFGS